MSTLHSALSGTNIHVPYAWTYADTAAREGATLAAADVGKFARQTDDNSIWMLTDDSPLTWIQVNNSATGAPTDAAYITTAANGTLSAEVVHPELYDASTGSEVDMSGAGTGTGVTAALSNGLWGVTFTNASWQYWDVASAISTGNFDVRMRVTSQILTSPKDGADAQSVLFGLYLSDSSRTFATSLNCQAMIASVTSGTPLVRAFVNAVIGKAVVCTQLPVILRIARSGTTVTFYYSNDECRTWGTLGTATSALDIAKIGAQAHVNSTGGHKTQIHWIKSV